MSGKTEEEHAEAWSEIMLHKRQILYRDILSITNREVAYRSSYVVVNGECVTVVEMR